MTGLRIALLTPAGRGAVATIRITATSALNWSRALGNWFHSPRFQRADEAAETNRLYYGRWCSADAREAESGTTSSAAEDVVVCLVDPCTAEIHCHGGRAAADRILSDLSSLGAVSGGESFDRFEAEWHHALSLARTWRTAARLLDTGVRNWPQHLEQLEADWRTGTSGKDLAARVRGWLHQAAFGLHLWQPWRVVLTGRPNAGKSSLLNRLLGYGRAIVTPIPGTTRDALVADTALDGWPVQLVDTAGIRETRDPLEQAGMAMANRELGLADLILRLVDLSAEDEVDLLGEGVDSSPPTIRVGTKVDLIDPRTGLHSPVDVMVSAVTGAGIANLATAIVQRLVPTEPPSHTPIPYTTRQVDGLCRLADALTNAAPAAIEQALDHLRHAI